MSALYEISSEYAKLLNEDIDPEMIADTLDGIEGEFTDKVGSMIAMIKNDCAYSLALKEESKKLTARASIINNRVDRIKSYIAESMDSIGKKTITSGVHQVTSRKKSVSVDITDLAVLPPSVCEYETMIKADKKEIKKLLTAGEKVAGAVLKYGKPSITIK